MENKKFNYTYKAPTERERKEIESIRRQYQPEVENQVLSKMELLRKLNSKVKSLPTSISLVFGVVGCLIFGLGMSLVLEFDMIALGIIFGVIGGVLMAFAYPIYIIILKKTKEKYKDEIIRLSDELLNEDK